MNLRVIIIVVLVCLLATCRQAAPVRVASSSLPAPAATSLTVDGAQRFQQIDGFGVNVNPASLDQQQIVPVINTLSSTLGTTIWRVIVEEADWETVNDNDDPFTFNWAYYQRVYETGEFPRVWAMLQYLEQHQLGTIVLNVMGRVPAWMGRTQIYQEAEDEWVEMICSFVVYARETKKRNLRLLSPTNEVDIGSPEGPLLPPTQYHRLLRKVADRLTALGHSEVQFIPPDIALVDQAQNYLPPLFADSVLMQRIPYFAFHDYGGRSGAVPDLIAASQYPDRNYWITEFSANCPNCDSGVRNPDPWSFGFSTLDLLIRHLEQQASAALIYEGYDSYYDHHQAFGYWGLISYDQSTNTYTTTQRLFLAAHVFRFVHPGMVRIGVAGTNDSLQLLAFLNPTTGLLTLVARQSSNEPLTVAIQLTGLRSPTSFQAYRSSSQENLVSLPDLVVRSDTITLTIPGQSAVTLQGQPPPTSQIFLPWAQQFR